MAMWPPWNEDFVFLLFIIQDFSSPKKYAYSSISLDYSAVRRQRIPHTSLELSLILAFVFKE